MSGYEQFIINWISLYEGKNQTVEKCLVDAKLDLLKKMRINPEMDFQRYVGCVDLHMHSKCSDGLFSPKELVFASAFLGLRAISIVDHITVSAYTSRELDRYKHCKVICYPGTEICTMYQGSKYHILAYGDYSFVEKINPYLKKWRKQWNQRYYDILKRLSVNGYPFVEKYYRNWGKEETFQPQMFEEEILNNPSIYLSTTSSQKYLPDTMTVLQIVNECGGMPVLAHPKKFRDQREEIDSFCEAGLGGIELFHPQIDNCLQKEIFEYGIRKRILFWGGSDFHGKKDKSDLLGRWKDNFGEKVVPFSIFAKSVQKDSRVIVSCGKIDINKLSIEEKIGLIMRPSAEIYAFDDLSFSFLRNNDIFRRIDKSVVNSEEKLHNFLLETLNANMHPILLNVNQEGGRLNTIDWADEPCLLSNFSYSRNNMIDSFIKEVTLMARYLRSLGITWNFAPVVDVCDDSGNFDKGTRCFYGGIDSIEKYACTYVKIMQNEKIATTAKHFPVLGVVDQTAHRHIPVVDDIPSESIHLYERLIECGIPSIMVSNTIIRNLDSQNPAFMSEKLVEGVLRKELHYEGVVITDNISMKSIASLEPDIGTVAVESFLAGVDCILFAPDFAKETSVKWRTKKINGYLNDQRRVFESILEAVQSGKISVDRLNISVRRILNMYDRYAIDRKEFLERSKLNEYRDLSELRRELKNTIKDYINPAVFQLSQGGKLKIKETCVINYLPTTSLGADSQWKFSLESGNFTNDKIISLEKKDVSTINELRNYIEKVLSCQSFASFVFISYEISMYRIQEEMIEALLRTEKKVFVLVSGSMNDCNFLKTMNTVPFLMLNNRNSLSVETALEELLE